MPTPPAPPRASPLIFNSTLLYICVILPFTFIPFLRKRNTEAFLLSFLFARHLGDFFRKIVRLLFKTFAHYETSESDESDLHACGLGYVLNELSNGYGRILSKGLLDEANLFEALLQSAGKHLFEYGVGLIRVLGIVLRLSEEDRLFLCGGDCAGDDL